MVTDESRGKTGLSLVPKAGGKRYRARNTTLEILIRAHIYNKCCESLSLLKDGTGWTCHSKSWFYSKV